jgi:hypothetical protein
MNAAHLRANVLPCIIMEKEAKAVSSTSETVNLS